MIDIVRTQNSRLSEQVDGDQLNKKNMLKYIFYGKRYVSSHKFRKLTQVNKHDCWAYFKGNCNKSKV